LASRTNQSSLPRATVGESLGVFAGVLAPNIAKGPIIRRPRMVALAERMDLDHRSVKRMQQLRNKYGTGPLMLRVPVREQAIVLDPEHLRRVLDQSPDPFSTASDEKRAALSHFEPKGALITPPGPERQDRRRFNEQVLQSDNPMHRLSERFIGVVEEEAEQLLAEVHGRGGELEWEAFIEAWFRVVRRVVFGDAARDDREMRKLTNQLRSDGNWAFLKPKRHRVRARFFERLNGHLARAEEGSLAQVIASVPKRRSTAPDHQVPQWLFAFDPAGMTTFRALALLATHPEQAGQAREEFRARTTASAEPRLPFLRACILESLRLWPTTPMVLRQTTEETTWETGVMPANTGVLIYAPFFHRDEQRLPFAHRFAPEVWMEEGRDDQAAPPRDWPLIPFSGGPAICPGRNLVLLLTSHMLGLLVSEGRLRLADSDRMEPGNLPGTLNNYGLRFRVDA
jgi:cytochrome P450